MAVAALVNCQIHADAIDLTGRANHVDVQAQRAARDITTFASNGRNEYVAGMAHATIAAGGFLDVDPAGSDPAQWAALAATQVVTIGVDSAAGAIAYLANPYEASWKGFGAIDEPADWSSTWFTRGPIGLARGALLLPATLNVNATGSTNGQQLGAATAQTLVAHLHVFAAAGISPTLDVAIRSKSSSGSVASGATTRLSFSQVTTAVAANAVERKTATVTTTDSWWGITYTIGGSSPSFAFAVALAIV